jgi:hypothetical protein
LGLLLDAMYFATFSNIFERITSLLIFNTVFCFADDIYGIQRGFPSFNGAALRAVLAVMDRHSDVDSWFGNRMAGRRVGSVLVIG